MSIPSGPEVRDHFVYRAWDSAGRSLYVGCTGNIAQRRANHRATSEWYQYADRVDLIGPFRKASALQREQEQIISLRPLFNALPEHAMLNRRRARRLSELQDQMCRAAGIVTKEQMRNALLKESVILQPIWDAAEAIVDAEFDLRCTHLGRIENYRRLIAEAAA